MDVKVIDTLFKYVQRGCAHPLHANDDVSTTISKFDYKR
jgi:hypothetical protein